MQNQKILILNFGGQYDQLIARRVRECSVYCEVKPYTMTLSEIRAFDPIGIIFTGGPDRVYQENPYHPAEDIFELAIRVIGEATKERLDILRDADAIFREEIAKAKLEMQMNQYFAVLTNMKSVGVMGDGRTYDWAVALRSVTTEDFMTADWSRIPYEVLDKVSGRIVNEVSHVNRVLYDITSKSPATVEFE